MKLYLTSTILVALFLIYKCSPSTNSSNIYINLDANRQISISDIFSKINIIPLETTEECLIGNINKLIKYDSTYYLLDSKQNCVFVFNQEGKFIYKIQRTGRGPGEYLYAYDFTINKHDHTIELLDCFGKLLIFNLDGSYKMTVNLPHPPSAYHKFSLLNQDSILFFTNSDRPNDNLLWLYSRSSGKIIKEFYNNSHSNIVNMLPLFSWNDTTYFSLPLENTIYRIQNSKAIPSYMWDFGKYNYHLQHKDIPQENIEKVKFYNMLGISSQMSYIHILNFQNAQYLYCLLSHFKKNKHIFYNKKTKSSYVFNKTKENIDIKTYFMNQKMLIGIDYPDSDSYKQLLKSNIINTNKQKLSSITEDANPVIIEYLF